MELLDVGSQSFICGVGYDSRIRIGTVIVRKRMYGDSSCNLLSSLTVAHSSPS